jgi:hypothetical protein
VDILRDCIGKRYLKEQNIYIKGEAVFADCILQERLFCFIEEVTEVTEVTGGEVWLRNFTSLPRKKYFPAQGNKFSSFEYADRNYYLCCQIEF